jgi:hypothetical protein
MGISIMDIAGYLLASGFALLVVLLGWANQITSKSKETKDLEADFLKQGKIKLTDYKKIVKDRGATDDSFKALVNFLYSEKKDNAEIFELIVRIKSDLIRLDRQYRFRFWILTLLSLCFFITGVASFFLTEPLKYWLLSPNLVLVVMIFINLISVYCLENRHNNNIRAIMEKV